jgi:nondiscriminating aspartyl-tRNA synthetase
MMKRTLLGDLSDKLDGKSVFLQGWAHEIRDLSKIKFVILHDHSGEVQLVALKKMKDFDKLSHVHPQSVLEVKGTVKKNKEARRGFEVVLDSFSVVSEAEAPLPMEIREDTTTHVDKRLDWRVLDLRRKKIAAIFKIQAKIAQAFRWYFIQQGFLEIAPPSIIGGASEGGTDVFKVKYFETDAYLAQSPQLYKQMCVVSGLEKVFSVMPVFRAEKHNTSKHLNEIRQLDMEIGFCDNKEALVYLEECFVALIKAVNDDCQEELALLDVTLKLPTLPFKRLTYKECINMLKKSGSRIEFGEDFDAENEKKLSELVGLDVPFFIVDWPTEMKPFYAMPYEDNPTLTKSYDLMYGGVEMSSGAQRIHLPELLEKQITGKGLDPKDFKWYIDAFRYGAPYHSGWSLGLERVTMVFTQQKNIREACLFPRDRDRLTP